MVAYTKPQHRNVRKMFFQQDKMKKKCFGNHASSSLMTKDKELSINTS